MADASFTLLSKVSWVSSFMVVLALAAPVRAQEPEGDGVAGYASSAPRIDGTHDASWNYATDLEAGQLLPGSVDDGQVSIAASWRALWDARYLYISVSVLDNSVDNQSDSAELWNDDSVEIYLDGDPDSGRTSYDGANDYQIMLAPGAAQLTFGAHSVQDGTGIQFGVVEAYTGYVVELAVPWELLDMAPLPGSPLGIDVHVNDDDDGGGRDRKLATFATTDDAWHDPSLFGRLLLGPSPAPGGELRSLLRRPRIDGVLEPEVWAAAPERLANQTARAAAQVASEKAPVWRALWDRRALYLFAEVPDTQTFTDSSEFWQDDSLEVYVDADHSRGFAYDGRNDFQYVFRLNDGTVHVGARSVRNTAGVRFATQSDGQVIRYELELPWSTLGVRPAVGRGIGLDVHVNDDDDGGTRDRKLSTFAEVDQAWQYPALFGSFALVSGQLARFDALGDLPGGEVASYVSDVSASGEVVVGWSRTAQGDEAVRWLPGFGLQGLGGPASRALGVSAEGKLIVGSVANPTYESGRAGSVWQGLLPFATLLGPVYFPAQPPLFYVVGAQVGLADGRVFGDCIQYRAYGDHLGCRVDAPGAAETFLTSVIDVADSAGNWAGALYPVRRPFPAFGSVALFNGAQLGYPTPSVCITPHLCESEVRDFSADHAVMVGTSLVPPADADPFEPTPHLFDTAFVYSAQEGMLRLDDLSGGEEASGAYAVSATGRVIAGFGVPSEGQRAVVWLDRVPHLLEELLVQGGGQLRAGWTLLEVRAMSQDGRTFVGNALNAAGRPEGFRVSLP